MKNAMNARPKTEPFLLGCYLANNDLEPQLRVSGLFQGMRYKSTQGVFPGACLHQVKMPFPMFKSSRKKFLAIEDIKLL